VAAEEAVDVTEPFTRLLRDLIFTNRYLLVGIAAGRGLTSLVVCLPLSHSLLGTAALRPSARLVALPFPFVVWGADETRRSIVRRRVTPGLARAT